MIVRSVDDVLGLKRVGRVVATVREELINHIIPGIRTIELDQIAAELLAEHGARSAPKQQYNFPGYTCISVNEEAAHGIPGDRKLTDGDMVNIDVSAEMDGYFADTGASIVVGAISPVQKSLCACGQSALRAAIAEAKTGHSINRIGMAIQVEAQKYGFTVIKNLCGHGIGRKLHEHPEKILNYYRKSENSRLEEGMVLAIEPFISTKAEVVTRASDGWTLKMKKGSQVVQYEHTIIVTNSVPMIITSLDR